MTEHKATPEQWALLEEQSAPEYDNTILELRARVEALEAAQQQEQDPDGNREDQFRCALLWVLWHHQGGSSPIGQPLRRFLGLGPHDRMNPAWVQLAQRWGEDYASSSALPETEAQAAPAGSLVERVAAAPNDRAKIREVAAWFRRGDAGAGSAWTVAADVLDAVLREEADRSTSQED
jgi:hypothetical protein